MIQVCKVNNHICSNIQGALVQHPPQFEGTKVYIKLISMCHLMHRIALFAF